MNFHFSALIIVELLPDGRLDEMMGKRLTVNSELKKEKCFSSCLMLTVCETQSTAGRTAGCFY